MLPVFTMESTAAHRHLPVDASLLRLRRHDNHSLELHLPRHDRSRRNRRVTITILNYRQLSVHDARWLAQ